MVRKLTGDCLVHLSPIYEFAYLTKTEFTHHCKMYYEYAAHINGSPTNLQYFTFAQNGTTRNHEKYTTRTTPDGKNHNIYGPAIIEYRPDGTISHVEYRKTVNYTANINRPQHVIIQTVYNYISDIT